MGDWSGTSPNPHRRSINTYRCSINPLRRFVLCPQITVVRLRPRSMPTVRLWRLCKTSATMPRCKVMAQYGDNPSLVHAVGLKQVP
jgi:hypothetical protein